MPKGQDSCVGRSGEKEKKAVLGAGDEGRSNEQKQVPCSGDVDDDEVPEIVCVLGKSRVCPLRS